MSLSAQQESAVATVEEPSPRPRAFRLVESIEDFDALADSWDELAGSVASPSVFHTHAWLECWWQSFGRSDKLAVPCLWEGDRLVAAAAMRISRDRFRALPVRKLSFLASGVSGCADLLEAEDRPGAGQALLQELEASHLAWDMMELSRVPQHSATWRWLTDSAQASSHAAIALEDYQVPVISVDRSWQEFLAGRSGSFRKNIRRRQAGIDKCSEPVQVLRLTDAKEIRQALPRMFEISSRSWKARAGRALTDSPGALDFYRRLTDRLGERGRVQLWMLTVGSAHVAFEYHLCWDGTVYPIRADFDERYAKLSPGGHLECEILRRLFEDPRRRVTQYNTCADNYSYERHWTDVLVPHGQARLFPRNFYGRLLHGLARLHRPRKCSEAPIGSVRQTT